jgi:starch phosphorylase
MRESMACLTPRYSASRTVREYTCQHYIPAAEAFQSRAANRSALGQQIVEWQHALDRNRSALRFGAVNVTSGPERHAFEVEVWLNDLDSGAVRVELYADGVLGQDPVLKEMTLLKRLGERGGCVYGSHVSGDRPTSDYTPRIVPYHAGVPVPLEGRHITWQR